MATARWRVRQSVAQQLGDLMMFEATADAPDGSTSLFTDARRLSRDEMLVANMDVVVVRATAPANLYWRTRLAALDRATRTATVDPPFPDYIRGGDRLHAVMHRGTGWRLEEYDLAINDTITELDKAWTEEVVSEVSTGFDRYTPYLDIPEGWVGVYAIEAQRPDGVWLEANDPFDLLQSERQVVVPYEMRAMLQAFPVRLHGYRKYAELEEDDDETKCPLGYLKWAAASTLLLSGESRQVTDEVENKAMLYLQRGESFMRQVASRIRPNSRWLD